jgi:hypothetical protein
MNIFEAATRKRIRFPYNGQIDVEDLWELGERQLNGVYKTLASQRIDESDSLFDSPTTDDVLELKIAIVRHVFETKRAEKELAEQAEARRAEKQRIMEVLAQRQDRALFDLPEEELLAKLEQL